MKFKSLLAVLVASVATAGLGSAQPANDPQKVSITEKVKVPGASLKPGDYTFSVEDRLQDRAIVRITALISTFWF